MTDQHAHTLRSYVVAAGAVLLMPLAATACGDDSAGPETGADVQEIADTGYFASDEYVGQTVTVSAEVTEVLSPSSFELGGVGYGDESLLVISAERADVRDGEVVKVTGKVEEPFDYHYYSNSYGLNEDSNLYERYGEENFLVADSVESLNPK